jgi:hypothetical protein
MSLHTRLSKLERAITSETAEHQGQPIRPLAMTDTEYIQAVKAKRMAMGVKPSQPLPILALIGD